MSEMDAEELVPLKACRRFFASHPQIGTLRRWARDGLVLDGIHVRLEVKRIGFRYFSSRESCQRFMEDTDVE